jgi:cytochrome c-type biogenesis protein CcmF
MVCAVITGVGMSAPLITQGLVDLHIVANQSSVQPSFYNKANFPVGILLAIGMGIGPYLAWRRSTGDNFLRLQYTYPAAVGLTALAMLAAWQADFRIAAPQLILLAASLFAVIANGQVIFASLIKPAIDRASIRTLGGHFAHIGGAALLLGIVCLVSFTRSDEPILVKGHSRDLDNLPYSISYTGMTSNLKDPKNDLQFVVRPKDGGPSFTALMPLAVRNSEGQMLLLARPAIFHKWWGDLYIALKDGPEDLSPTTLQKFSLVRGQTANIVGYKVTFNSFYIDPATAAMAQSGVMPRRFPVSAILTVVSPDGVTKIVKPQNIRDQDDPVSNGSPELNLPGLKGSPWAVAFTGMEAAFGGGGGQADFYIRDASIAPVQAFTIEVSTRPGIGLVWLGTCLIAAGGLMSMRRRLVENRLVPIGDPESDSQQTQNEPQREHEEIPSRPPSKRHVADAMKGHN